MSAAVALFDLRMLLRGRAALPARGMRALPEALAQGLPTRTVRLNTPVLELVFDAARRVVGVRTPHGELRGSAVVLATDGDTTARLLVWRHHASSLAAPRSTWTDQQRPFTQKLLVQNALPDAFVNDATLLTNIAPEYAPSGWHLLAAHVLHANGVVDGTLEARARADLQRWFPHVELVDWRTLSVFRTPRSQFQQPPHARGALPATRTRWPGLYLAGEITQDSSLNGAIRSGEAAARIVANDLRPRP